MNRSAVTADSQDPAPAAERGPAFTPRDIAAGVLLVIAIGLAFLFLVRFHWILFLFLVALIVAMVTRPAVRWLAARGIPPQIGVVLMYLLLALAVAGFAAMIVPLLLGQFEAVVDRLPLLYSSVRASLIGTGNRLVARLARGLPADFSAIGALAATTPAANGLSSLGGAWGLVQSTGNGLFVVGAVLVLAFYLVTEGEFVTRRVLLLLPPDRRDEVRDLWGEMEGTISGFFRGQAILMGIVALLSAVGYLVIGLPYALGLAVIAGICEVIPMVGPAIATVAAAVVAISMAPDKLVLAVLVGVIAQFLENNLLVPRVMDRSVGINPIITLISISAFGTLFGVPGAVLSIPLAAMLQIVVGRILSRSGRTRASGRGHVSVLRLAAREVAADVRRGVASGGADIVAPEIETAEDQLEAIATDLDGLLQRLEAEA